MENLLFLLCVLSCHQPAIQKRVDQARDIRCLAEVGFSEARGEKPAGMAAVMQVVLNRTRDTRWPPTVCKVTAQASQFLAVEAWQIPRVPTANEVREWRLAMRLAEKLVAGERLAPAGCAGATHFDRGTHIEKDKRLVKLCTLGAHIFYVEPQGNRL